MQEAHHFKRVISKPVEMQYLLHVPPGTGKHPLMLFLHGRGESGDDLELVKKYGIPKIISETPEFPFITFSPQVPVGMNWVLLADTLEALLDEALSRPDVDTSRVYLTGLSMGGYGTWHLAAQRPEVFAAIAPICGAGSRINALPERICRLKHTPVWAFHGEDDDVVLLEEQQVLIDALRECSEAEVRFTVYPGVGHNSWTRTYANPDLYDWFLSYRKL